MNLGGTNMKHSLIVVLVLLLGAAIPSYADVESQQVFGYISLVEDSAFVLQEGKTEAQKAMVNFPLMPGDLVYTTGKGRCELQFDNGTVMRIDKSSKVRVKTIRAESLTTKWKITTLELLAGNIYSMNNIYNREMFQIVTPHAAFKMSNNSTSAISLDENGSHIYVDRGKVGVLFGEGPRATKKEFIRAKTGSIITAGNEFKIDSKRRNAEFYMWNDYVNNNFKDLHTGISKVPKPIYKYPRSIVEFAEKWSSIYGEWEYDDILGYVWKPYQASFADRRPFFDAKYVWVKKQLYVVPTQAWGWVPAHMGTWHWMKKKGWVWIPGTAFSPGMIDINMLWNMMNGYRFQFFWPMYANNWNFWSDWRYYPRGYKPFFSNTLDYWVDYIYGGYNGYFTYRREGATAWSRRYKSRVKGKDNQSKPSFKGVPNQIVNVIKKMNRSPLKDLKRHINSDRSMTFKKAPGLDMNRLKTWLVYRNNILNKQNNYLEKEKPLNRNSLKRQALVKFERDWNPDRVISNKLGVALKYNSEHNAVVIPSLKISSHNVTNRIKYNLRQVSKFDVSNGKLSRSSLMRNMPRRSSGYDSGTSTYGHTGGHSVGGRSGGVANNTKSSGGVSSKGEQK
jgi:hypothetical protein